jgi:hypothetical protein
MTLFSKTIFSLVFVCGVLGLGAQAHAATKTICASGCDYSTIADAIGISPAEGDVYEVRGPGAAASAYDPTSEAWPLTFPSVSSTILCTGGATIGPAVSTGGRLYLTTSSTIQGCIIGAIQLSTNPALDSSPPGGVIIRGNTFITTGSSTIEFSSGADQFLIENNTNINSLSLGSTSTNGIIRNNTFYGNQAGRAHGVIFNTSASSSGNLIISNTFNNYSTTTLDSQTLISIAGFDETFASNTIRYVEDYPLSAGLQSSLEFTATGTNYIGGNYIDSPNYLSGCAALMIYSVNDSPWVAIYNIQHNTFRRREHCEEGSPITYSTASNRADVSVDFGIDYNLFYNASSSAGEKPGVQLTRDPLTSLVQTNSHNGIYNFGSAMRSEVSGSGGSDIADATTIYTDPSLELSDVDTTNDLHVAPFSPYLDVVGTQDIGATNEARRSTIFVDDTGSVDYLTVDATTTSGINTFVRTGDTVMLAAGTYGGFSVNSANATSSITIQGAGVGTIINAGAGSNGITFSNVSSSHIANLVVQNATGVGAASYTMTNILAHAGSTNYNEMFGMLGLGASQLAIFTDSSTCDGGPPTTIVSADGDNITAATFGGTTAFHLAAVQLMGAHFTVLLPNSQFANQAALESYLSGVCMLPPPAFSVDGFADNLFTVSGGVYSYDAGSLLSSGMTLVSGVTDPPAITYTPGTAFAGIKLMGGSNNNTISGVTSTGNGYGIRFASGTDNSNTLSDSTLSSNTYYDVLSAAAAVNTFDNVTFTRTSSSVGNLGGSLLVKFRARVHVTDVEGGAGVGSIAASSTDLTFTETSFGSTDGTGHTAYIHLPAYTINVLGSALTNGGFNPYIVQTGATAGYAASSTDAFTLSSPDQEISIAAIRTAPAAPTGISVSEITSSTATITWTDNATNESSQLFDFANVSAGEVFPTAGITELSANAIGTGVVGFSPDRQYRVRIAALNAGGRSAYNTSAPFYMLAATPVAPTVSAVSRTAVSVSVGAGENATSTEYAIYSSTLGGYLSGAGAVSGSPTWQTTTTWATLSVGSLTCGTSYSFATIARNHDAVETATSTSAAATTSACETVVSSGGGGGGGGGSSGGGAIGGSGGASGPIQTFFNAPLVPRVVPVLPVPPLVDQAPLITAPTAPSPLPEETTPAPQTQTLTQFLQEGGSQASRGLGQGERAAVLRDLQEVLGRTAANIPVSDLERVASGQIPLTRNLAYERSMAPRALASFRTIFGHAPNFRNATENLAWNTLMYRIRFTRDLREERQGITSFRQTFNTNPQTPFQWSVVRVLGYLR